MSTIYWGNAWARTDLGGWVCAKIRPRWYWAYRKVWLFLRLVWRLPDSAPGCTRIDIQTAWATAGCIYDDAMGPQRVHRGPIPDDLPWVQDT